MLSEKEIERMKGEIPIFVRQMIGEENLDFVIGVTLMAKELTRSMCLCTCAAHNRLGDFDDVHGRVMGVAMTNLHDMLMDISRGKDVDKNESMKAIVILVRDTTEKELGVV